MLGISALDKCLHYYSLENTPKAFAYTKYFLGHAYLFHAQANYDNPTINLNNAIMAFEEALKFFTHEYDPLMFANIKNNLGVVYVGLSDYLNPLTNLDSAKTAHKEALNNYSKESTPLEYAQTQCYLGHAYNLTAMQKESPAKNLKKAKELLSDALIFITPEQDSFWYSITQADLGAVYGLLADYEDRINNLENSGTAAKETLRFLDNESNPLRYGRALYNLGLSF